MPPFGAAVQCGAASAVSLRSVAGGGVIMRAASRVAVRHKFARSSPALVAWTHCRPHACAVRSLSAAPGSDTEPAAGCVSSVSVRNSFARQGALTPLAPSKGNTLTWYACGPTVYDDAHLGHARTYVCQDILRRVMERVHGWDVQFVMGVTDIDDKIIVRSTEHECAPAGLAAVFESRFMEDMAGLGVRRPEALLRVSDHMPDIVEYIAGIMERSLAYAAEDGVYFDTTAFGPAYGQCFGDQSHVDQGQADESAGDAEAKPTGGSTSGAGSDARIKRNPRDFALWKRERPGEPSWESPWGRGRPGWHIECSAMTHSLFGDELAVHSGGVDLAFPHHTNEVAQCEAFCGTPGALKEVELDSGDGHHVEYSSPWVGTFLHTGHLYISGRKMSKSLKNFITVRELLDKHSADEFRVFCLQHRYNRNVTFNEDRMRDAASFLNRVKEVVVSVREVTQSQRPSGLSLADTGRVVPPCARPNSADLELLSYLRHTKARVVRALRTDFATDEAMAELHKLLKECSRTMSVSEGKCSPEALHACCNFVTDTLKDFGVSGVATLDIQHPRAATPTDGMGSLDAVAQALLQFRNDVRQAALQGDKGDVLAVCDTLRDKVIPSLGLKVRDRATPTPTALPTVPSAASDSEENRRRQKQAAAHKKQMLEANKRAAIPPQEFFKQTAGEFSQFDEAGVPTHDGSGEPLSKSRRKKLAKQLRKHEKAHNRFMARTTTTS